MFIEHIGSGDFVPDIKIHSLGHSTLERSDLCVKENSHLSCQISRGIPRYRVALRGYLG